MNRQLRGPAVITVLLTLLPTVTQAQAPAGSVVAVPQPVSPGAPRWIRGTPVQLMVVREVNSRTAKPGDVFPLRVNAPVMIDGQIAIPVGATATCEVIAAKGTSAAGGKGQLSLRLVAVNTPWGSVPLIGTSGKEGAGNGAGVALSVLSVGLLGLLTKGGNATFKAGDLIAGQIATGENRSTLPMVVP